MNNHCSIMMEEEERAEVCDYCYYQDDTDEDLDSSSIMKSQCSDGFAVVGLKIVGTERSNRSTRRKTLAMSETNENFEGASHLSVGKRSHLPIE